MTLSLQQHSLSLYLPYVLPAISMNDYLFQNYLKPDRIINLSKLIPPKSDLAKTWILICLKVYAQFYFQHKFQQASPPNLIPTKLMTVSKPPKLAMIFILLSTIIPTTFDHSG